MALHEPIPARRFAGLQGEAPVFDGVGRSFGRMRRTILTRGGDLQAPVIFRTLLPVLAKRLPCWVMVRNRAIRAYRRFGENYLPAGSDGAADYAMELRTCRDTRGGRSRRSGMVATWPSVATC